MLQRALTFLRILDDNANLSLTNISVIGVVGKIVSSGAISQTDVLALLAVLANYAIKKAIVYFEDRTPTPQTVDLAALSETVAALKGELEDAKNKISGLSLAAGVSRPPIRG